MSEQGGDVVVYIFITKGVCYVSLGACGVHRRARVGGE
jgi:hypothetical protein